MRVDFGADCGGERPPFQVGQATHSHNWEKLRKLTEDFLDWKQQLHAGFALNPSRRWCKMPTMTPALRSSGRSRSRRRTLKRKVSRYWFWISYGLLSLAVAVFFSLVGLLLGYAIDLPQVQELQKIRPSVVSYVHADDGRVLGQFALEKRMLVSYQNIPEVVKQSILSAEDANFFGHAGIDFWRLLSTIVNDILRWEKKGASTLTMQLSKLRFTSSEKSIERKIKDMLFAIEIEKNYSKEQILAFYCNQIYLGHGTYGIAAAADFYFGRALPDLTLNESATLAGLIQSPENYSPLRHPERALNRRNYVLRRLHQEDYIDRPTLESQLQAPLEIRRKSRNRSPAPYFVEWVRRYLERNYTTDQIWKEGLKVYTTVDYDIQMAAQKALREGLKAFDKQMRRWRKIEENILDLGQDLESYHHPSWRQIFYEGQLVYGLVLESNQDQAKVKIGSYRVVIEAEDVEWTGIKRVHKALRPGDVAIFTIRKIDAVDKSIEAILDRIPQVQGALLAIENKTGAIKAMVGGFDFEYSQFNRATQALRQPGSIFKPFTYVAALENGYAPSDEVLDAPVTFLDGLGRVYEPTNVDEEFDGLITVRQALAKSRNVPTLRLANALGIERVIDVVHRFGIERDFPPFLPIAIGAGEVTLQEITSAFSTFPNQGVRVHPYFIQRVENYHGANLEEHRQNIDEVLSPQVAHQMVEMMQSVVRMGTAGQARKLKRPIGGKTGTTNESTDSWFVGFTPRLTAGVWAGFDKKKSLGERVYGSTLALPIWIEFMKETLQDTPVEEFERTDAPAIEPNRRVDPRLVQRRPETEPPPAVLATVQESTPTSQPQAERASRGILIEDIISPAGTERNLKGGEE